MMDTKFCTSCQTTQPLATGQYKQSRHIRRWICLGCINKKCESMYKSHRADAIRARERNSEMPSV